jgi:hypothetical protein
MDSRELHGSLDSANRRPTSKLLYRLRAPHQWWTHSIVRILAGEFYNFPRRILAVLRKPSLGEGWQLPTDIPDGSPANFYALNNWLQVCSKNTLRLQSQYQWLGSLELEICAQAFALGAEWAFRSSCTGTRTELPASSDSSQPVKAL